MKWGATYQILKLVKNPKSYLVALAHEPPGPPGCIAPRWLVAGATSQRGPPGQRPGPPLR